MAAGADLELERSRRSLHATVLQQQGKERRRPRHRGRQRRRDRGRRQRQRADRPATGSRRSPRASSARARSPTPRRSPRRSRTSSPSTSSRRTSASGSPTSASPCARCSCRRSTTPTSSRPRSASRPRTTSRCRSTRRCSTGRSIGHTDGDNGERRVEVVVVAARADMVVDAARGARQGRPAAGRDRPLGVRHDPGARGGEPRRRRRRRVRRRAGTYEEASRAAGDADQPAASPSAPRTAQLYCNLGDVANLAVAQGSTCLFTRISPFGIEGIAQKLAERRQLTLEHARQWLVHVGLAGPGRGDRGRPARPCRHPRGRSTRAPASSPTSCGSRSSTTAPRRRAVAVEGIVACGPGTTIPGLVERLQRDLGHPVRGRPPGGARAARRGRGGPADPLLRPRAGGLARAPRQPDPARGAPRRPRAVAHRRAPLRDPRRARVAARDGHRS